MNSKIIESLHGLSDILSATEEQLEQALNLLLEEITEPDARAAAGMQSRLDAKIKPVRSLGVLEDIAVQIAGIMGTDRPVIRDRAVLLMAGDHGVVAEGVSAAPQEITAQMFYSYLSGGGGINVLASHGKARVIPTDVGMVPPLDPPHLMERRVKDGTDNMAKGPAMSRTDALKALFTGALVAAEAAESGVNLLATGEVGIGNTTPSAALISVFTGHSVEEVTGRGTGLKDDALLHKQQVIRSAIELNRPDPSDPLDTLSKVGGLEIAALAGMILEASCRRIPVILDGIISMAGALTAARLCPSCSHYLITSHSSEEKGHEIGLRSLGLKPRLDLNMRLGEGTGAALMFPLVDAALKVADEMATFEAAGVTTGDF